MTMPDFAMYSPEWAKQILDQRAAGGAIGWTPSEVRANMATGGMAPATLGQPIPAAPPATMPAPMGPNLTGPTNALQDPWAASRGAAAAPWQNMMLALPGLMGAMPMGGAPGGMPGMSGGGMQDILGRLRAMMPSTIGTADGTTSGGDPFKMGGDIYGSGWGGGPSAMPMGGRADMSNWMGDFSGMPLPPQQMQSLAARTLYAGPTGVSI